MIILTDKDCRKLDRLEKAFYKGAREFQETLEDSDTFYDPFAEIMRLLRNSEYKKVDPEAAAKDQANNPPLTLDELFQLDREPVFLVVEDKPWGWVIRPGDGWANTRNPEPMVYLDGYWYPHSDYGKTWVAYRQKP